MTAMYSGGNKRKLMLAVALCGDPTLAVLDEPSAGIDPAARRRLWRVVNASLARGCTVALTTHHMAEAAHLGSRIGIMVRGRLACIGSPQHLKLKLKNRHFSAVTLEVTKLTLSKRVVEGLYEVPKPLLVSPNHSPTINELMASLQRRY